MTLASGLLFVPVSIEGFLNGIPMLDLPRVSHRHDADAAEALDSTKDTGQVQAISDHKSPASSLVAGEVAFTPLLLVRPPLLHI